MPKMTRYRIACWVANGVDLYEARNHRTRENAVKKAEEIHNRGTFTQFGEKFSVKSVVMFREEERQFAALNVDGPMKGSDPQKAIDVDVLRPNGENSFLDADYVNGGWSGRGDTIRYLALQPTGSRKPEYFIFPDPEAHGPWTAVEAMQAAAQFQRHPYVETPKEGVQAFSGTIKVMAITTMPEMQLWSDVEERTQLAASDQAIKLRHWPGTSRSRWSAKVPGENIARVPTASTVYDPNDATGPTLRELSQLARAVS